MLERPSEWSAGVSHNDVEREQILQDWKANMVNLGRYPNVYVKVSGLCMPCFGFGYAENNEPPTIETLVEQLGPLVLFVIQVFQPRRCMFGSNFPVDKVSVPSLETLIQAYKKIVENLPVSDQGMIFHGTATEFYRLNQDSTEKK